MAEMMLSELYERLLVLAYSELGCNLNHARTNPRLLQSVRGRYLAWSVLYMRYGYTHQDIANVSHYHRTSVLYGIKITTSQPTKSEDGRLLDWLMMIDVETTDEDNLEEL